MTDPNFYIETPRLYLSYFDPSKDAHCDFLVYLYNTPEFIASLCGKSTHITTREAARKRLATLFIDEHVRNGYGTYLVSLKPDGANSSKVSGDISIQQKLQSCKMIGSVSLLLGETYTAPDLGFAIVPEETRKGYAKEASKGLLKYAKEILGIDAVLGLFYPSNESSRAMFRSLGFESRGVRKLDVFNSKDGEVWALPGMDEDLSVYGL
ncbi:uncharacterized protein K452DRAFT_292971 [Aplosporella prunicola CBS 121167]|uniref:N-acetyltransferase domain-containing protein n=1 Tax=Aplosporella prunicola CBS 121167 TaxID=1176127 RepID=A0A6A6AUY1_9PEZI|nr:uncharacterized protein K452DRAFT_292971 [Aplosporella prunicola CBS 121167]KAF2135749.1 hypothetical protein K452DRAFT_292971 [Aplosporella prunicola CBS 121167]